MKFYRINFQIQARELRVLDDKGELVGVITKDEALTKAKELGVDLVEIAPQAVPPVARLIDFKKFKYMEDKKQREAKRNSSKGGDTKEIRLGPFISENDFNVRIERAKEFLGEGHKVRLALKFTGRQITHPEFGWKQIRKFIETVANIAKTEREPRLEGKMLVATLSPNKKGSHAETQNTQGSTQPLQSNENR